MVERSLHHEIEQRFGVLPNFFRLTSDTPEVTANLWGFAKFAYLDSPLPSLFKERLFVYLSRFCEVRYCIARHIGFLVGLGYPAGDRDCLPQTVEQVLPLLQRSLPRGEDLESAISSIENDPDRFDPASDTPEEEAIFACAAHVFLQTADAPRAIAALRQGLGTARLELLNVFLAFVRMAHYWTQTHLELRFEDDINDLLATHETLANCILNDPEIEDNTLSQQVLALAELRQLKAEHESLQQAYEAVSRENEQLPIERQERQRVEENLRESEEQLRLLITASSDIVYKMSADWRELRRLEGKEFLTSIAYPSRTWLEQYIPLEDQPQVMAVIEAAIRTKSPFELEHRVIQRDGTIGWTASRAIPLLNDQQEIVEWIGAASDISDRMRVEVDRNRREANLAFLAEVSHDLARLNNVEEMIDAIGSKIGAHFNASVCAFGEVDEAQQIITITHEWKRADLPSWKGTHHISNFHTEDFRQTCRAGEIYVVRDAENDRRSNVEQMVTLSIGAFVSVPLVRNGEWQFQFTVADVTARDWRDDEIELIRELTTRIWTRLERVRTEAALRESEEKYRTLFELIDEGFCVCELIGDEASEAYNYRILEINPAFEALTGLQQAPGKTGNELIPTLEPFWYETYARVVRTGEPTRFESYLQAWDSWFDVYVTPIGVPQGQQFAVLFSNITDRRRREANLTFLAEIQDDCARLTTAEAMMQTIGAKIGAHLNLSVCAFVDIDEAQDRAIVSYAWHRADALNLVGTYRISEFVSEEFYVAARGGTVVVVNNTNTDARTDAESCAAIGVQAFIHVPFLYDGEWKFLLNVYDARPREWREDEIELFCDLANRIFPRLERARAEAALRASEEKYRTLFNSLDEGVGSIELIFDENDRVVDYCYLEQNPSFARLTGLPSDVIGKCIREIVPNLEPFWFETFERVAKTGEPQRFEHEVAALNRWFEVNVSRVGGVGSRTLVYVYNNITDRKATEAIIAADLENTRLLQELSARLINEDEIQVLYDEVMATAIALMKADAGTVQILDPATQDLVLLATQGFDRTMTDHFYRVNASSNTPCGIALDRGTRTFVDFDVPGDDPDGSLQMHVEAGYLSAQSTPLISRSGKPIGMVSTHWCRQHRPSDRELRFLDLLARQAADLIERRQTEAALRDSEELKQSILESSKDCIKVLTFNGEIVYVNTGGLRLLEIDDPMLMLNARWLDFWQGKDRENAKTAIAAAKAGNTGQFQGYRPTHQGTPKWWDILITPVRDSAGQITQLLVVSRDITKQKQAETERERLLAQEQAAREQAETANRIKDEFLAVLSHELRSPLNPILGWSKLLQQRKMNPEKTMAALATIERNAQLQVQLIDDLLDISRILRGKLSLAMLPVDLSAVISAAQETVQLAAEAKHIQIQTAISPNVGIVIGDAGRLQQVLWNLLSNAVKFTPQGGQVTITLTSDRTHAQIQVSDTGKGIHADFLPYVFEHFRQEDGATTRKFGGLGLGMAIARQIVEMHGGQIRVDSPGEGLGATFTVRLPLTRSKVLPAVQRSFGSTGNLSGTRILVVDDETDSREFVAFVLEQAGAIVTSVASGRDALQTFSQSVPNLIVSDIGMPEMDGYMLIRQIRTLPNGQPIPAIALTAYAGEFDQQQAIQAGFQRHLAKPIDPGRVIAIVTELLSSVALFHHSRSRKSVEDQPERVNLEPD